MSGSGGRSSAVGAARAAEGWSVEALTRPSRLYGANGMRTGSDGRIYVAQVPGSSLSAIDPDTGDIEVISPLGGPIVAPDDLAFDEDGNIYVTEITKGNVRMLSPKGESRIVYGDLEVANPITYHQGRLIAAGCRMGSTVLELDRDGGAPRVIAEDVPMPNAFEVGPDGKLYMPVMGANEIWRVSLEGGRPEVVATDLGVPDSVKFDSEGFIVSTQVASGQVLRIDPSSGDKTVLAQLPPGLDNVTFADGRIFVSHMLGSIHEILGEGKVRPLVEQGLQWPLDVAIGDDGVLFVADGGFCFTLRPGGELHLEGMLFTPGYPGYSRGADVAGPGEYVVTTANGDVARWSPARGEHQVLASGFDRLMGVQLGPKGEAVFAEFGTGKVHVARAGALEELGSGLAEPKGVAIGPDGSVYVSESAGGCVSRLAGGRAETVADGLARPEGIAVAGSTLYALDTSAKELIAFELEGSARQTLASGLPVGTPGSIDVEPLGGVGDMSGPMGNFTGIDVGADGSVYVCGDLNGSVLAVRRAGS